MKTLLLILAIIAFSFTLAAQDTTRTEEYCNMVVKTKMMQSNYVQVVVDYGSMKTPQAVRDSTGKFMTFTGMVDALNYMNKSGWEFAFAYETRAGGFTFFNCLLKRKFDNPE